MPTLTVVHDLPQIYQKPAAGELISVLELLSIGSSEFSSKVPNEPSGQSQRVDPSGIPRYITSIISSSLEWIDDDNKEQIWNLASLRLSERSGRTAMPSVTRTFQVADELAVRLHEPSLTGDNLGLKTWSSSFFLARLLPTLQDMIPLHHRVLELGAGTGLLGISAACFWQADVLLTDLDEVIPNLQANLALNEATVQSRGGRVTSRALDWAEASREPTPSTELFSVILVADPVYSPEHPRMLVGTITQWLAHTDNARVVIALPLREHYCKERSLVRTLLEQADLLLVKEGVVSGYDDWYTKDGEQVEVKCSWSIWRRCSKTVS